MPKFTRFTCNLVPAGTRLEQLEGREHLVVPMVILTEGVHSGTGGPLLYPKEELSKTPAVWNQKPIVVYHPTLNGEGISACDPTVVNNRKIGVMMNTRWEGGRLKSEAWIERPRADAVDDRVMKAVDAKEMMELSTGVFVDVEDTSGKWKSEEYDGIARNYRPDHLALLPDQIGACSIQDGAGFMRNQTSAEKMMKEAREMMKKAEEEEDEEMMKRAKKMMKKAEGMVQSSMAGNEMSHGNIQSSLAAAVRKKFNVTDAGPFIWVADVYSNFFVYEKEGKLWRLGYTASDDGVTLSEDPPTEVVRVTEYRTSNGMFVGNQTNKNNTTQNMKKEIVDAIIAAKAGWDETAREGLMALNEPQLKIIQNGLPKSSPTPAAPGTSPQTPTANGAAASPGTAPGAATTASAPAPGASPSAPLTSNQELKKPVTLDEYIAAAPREVQDVLRNSMVVHNEEKARLIKIITDNKQNAFAKEDLEARSLAELRNLARLAAPVEVANLEGQRAPLYSGQAPVDNTTNGEEALECPVINFEANKKAA